MNRRQHILGVLLFATVVAAVFAPDPQGTAVVAPKERKTAAVQTATPAVREIGRQQSTADIDVLKIRGREGEEDMKSIFTRPHWLAAPEPERVVAPVIEAPPPVQEQAPPLPFRVMGRYIEDGQEIIFLQYNDQALLARVGEQLLDQYRIESLAGGVMTIVYLPLNERQVLQVGEAP